jgi:pimeloyl-ACP methyl ester carboxylesterase
VLVLPGFLASDASTTPLRSYLRRLGYHVHGWGLGRNVGPFKLILLGMRDRLDELAHSHRRPVTIIGWSLGGIFSRELARERPEAVRQVITLGSPFRLTRHGPTRARWVFERLTHLHVDPSELPLPEHTRNAVPVPASAVYSRSDGIVPWLTCVEAVGHQRENIEVRGSHCGLGHNPAVVWAVADRLAQVAPSWRPFRPPAWLRHLYPRPVAGPTADAVTLAS